MQVLNVDKIKFGDTWLILPTATFFGSMPTFPAIWYFSFCSVKFHILHKNKKLARISNP